MIGEQTQLVTLTGFYEIVFAKRERNYSLGNTRHFKYADIFVLN
jgi:hypothetical protein